MTKNDIYAELIRMGVDKGYVVIPEFRVDVPGAERKKNIDLVWVRPRRANAVSQDRENMEYWNIHATFEIEGCNVNIRGREFNRHFRDLPLIRNGDSDIPISHHIVLYTNAYDRRWRGRPDVDSDISQRRQWAQDLRTDIAVLDGRNLDLIREFEEAPDYEFS